MVGNQSTDFDVVTFNSVSDNSTVVSNSDVLRNSESIIICTVEKCVCVFFDDELSRFRRRIYTIPAYPTNGVSPEYKDLLVNVNYYKNRTVVRSEWKSGEPDGEIRGKK